MKVCTDACLFGAWLADIIKGTTLPPVLSMLDIGSGTGLLALMIAQYSMASIDAVEIDPYASREATANFNLSPWSNRLEIFNISIQEFSKMPHRYNLIFSNPPFFNNNLKGPDEKRNLALHDGSLSLEELLIAADKLLLNEFYFALLLPFQRTEYFESLLSKSSFKLIKKTNVRQTNRHPIFRSMYFLCKTNTTVEGEENEMIIKDGEQYSAQFQYLLNDYYLSLT
ncbi:MAG: methyltransferase [Flavitalea sp.]